MQTPGKIFLSLLKRALRNKEIAAMDLKLAYSHFAGIMRNIPRLTREGTLRGNAARYLDTVAEAAWRCQMWEASDSHY
ncbi:MAG: hypothetical protein ABIP64_08635 [Burkholderiales bacterium]